MEHVFVANAALSLDIPVERTAAIALLLVLGSIVVAEREQIFAPRPEDVPYFGM